MVWQFGICLSLTYYLMMLGPVRKGPACSTADAGVPRERPVDRVYALCPSSRLYRSMLAWICGALGRWCTSPVCCVFATFQGAGHTFPFLQPGQLQSGSNQGLSFKSRSNRHGWINGDEVMGLVFARSTSVPVCGSALSGVGLKGMRS